MKIIVFRALGQPCYRRSPTPLSEQATGGKSMNDLHDDVFAISPDIRYVATAHGQQLKMRSRPDLQNASSSNSDRSEEHTSELQSPCNLVCRLLLEKQKKTHPPPTPPPTTNSQH